MPDSYAIRDGYTARLSPQYFADAPAERIYQPDVYRDLARIAKRLGSTRLIDVGCGNGAKLVAHRDAFELVGVDFGPNIAECRARYDFGTWLEADLGTPGPLLDDPAPLKGATLVCADVIEHVPAAEILVAKLAGALEHADALLISTPDRALVRGLADPGPPRNQAHVREWTLRELGAFLRRGGLEHGTIGLTRPHDHTLAQQTIFAVYTRDPAALTAVEDVLIDAPLPPAPPAPTLIQRAARRLRP
jgi:SAM-dependent methyltransferase